MLALFRQLTLVNPLRHFLEIVRSIFLKGDGLSELAVPFTVLDGVDALALTFRRLSASTG